MCESRGTALPPHWLKEKPLPSTQVVHTHMTKHISRGVLTPRYVQSHSFFPVLKLSFLIHRNKGKVKCHKVMHYFRRCSSNPSYTPAADLVPCCHDTGSHRGSGTYQGFLSVKAKLSFAISVTKSMLQESKGSAWMTGTKATTPGSWALSSHCLWCSRSPGPPYLWDEPRKEHNHSVWMLLPFSCPGVVCDQCKPCA